MRGRHTTWLGSMPYFVKALRADTAQLRMLGNGMQRKSYLCVADCVNAMCVVIDIARDGFSITNLGTDHCCRIGDSVGRIVSARHAGTVSQP